MKKQTRITRYEQFIRNEFAGGLTKNKEYCMSKLDGKLRDDIVSGKFKQVVFTGMGCSAIVSDLIKGFFIESGVPVYVDVVNDYEFDYLMNTKSKNVEETLFIISSYSGFSKEPIIAYKNIKKLSDNIILLTSGGDLEQLGLDNNESIINWRLTNPDREYPLFHAHQYFAIILDIFHKLNILPSNYEEELRATSDHLETMVQSPQINESAIQIARRLSGGDVLLMASPKWYQILLKLVKMHFNEISMTPAHRNYIHEFCHSEVAVFTDPMLKHGILHFQDEEDEYTKAKTDNLESLLTANISQNQNIEFIRVKVEGKDFFHKLFSTLLYVQLVVLEMGSINNTKSRDLISTAAGNVWYSLDSVKKDGGDINYG
ncbi:MAG: hypothetical protein HRT35_05630 [Algicola sp.]|nr:hypothetical protein [Algicola sp.]